MKRRTVELDDETWLLLKRLRARMEKDSTKPFDEAQALRAALRIVVAMIGAK